MTLNRWLAACLSGFISIIGTAQASDNTVNITPLGSHDGEFCGRDRALIFEDPTGTRILYDAGRTVAGAKDPRLGDIDVVLVSHVHGDHLGDKHIEKPNSGTCEKPDTSVSSLPNSNSVAIAMEKKAKIVTGSEMPTFFANKLKALGGNPKDAILVRFGGNQTIGNVDITTVPAVHSNGLAPEFLSGAMAEHLKENGVKAYVGPPTGYVLKFSNGLVVYLSGDTGMTAEQQQVVQQHYQAKLAVMNIGGTFTTGPTQAAWVINNMVKPNAVIASHANEAATKAGKVIAGTRTEAFMQATNVPVYVPLSGKTMHIGADGLCTSGC